jgi:hypothetical protein
VFGYYSASGQSSDGRFVALSPSRILDTRTTSKPAPAPAPASPSPSPSPSPTSTTPANPGDTKNCGDFSPWSEAQEWFEFFYPHCEDVANLDADGDLVACESLPGAPSNPRTGGNIKASAGSSNHWDNCQGPPTVVMRQDDCRHAGCDRHGQFEEPARQPE